MSYHPTGLQDLSFVLKRTSVAQSPLGTGRTWQVHSGCHYPPLVGSDRSVPLRGQTLHKNLSVRFTIWALPGSSMVHMCETDRPRQYVDTQQCTVHVAQLLPPHDVQQLDPEAVEDKVAHLIKAANLALYGSSN
eukprot:4401380-Amphidinium_carterae.2